MNTDRRPDRLDLPYATDAFTPIGQRYAHHQAGATLIVVLVMVLLLAIVGAMAVRSSQVTLDMTTSSQVNQLLMQSSDVPLAKLEMSAIEPGADNLTQLQNMMKDTTGPLSLLTTEGKKDAEYVLCYQPTVRSGLYKKGEHRVIVTKDFGTMMNADGYCKVKEGTENYFTSARKTVASQVSITRPTVNGSSAYDLPIKPFAISNIGTDDGSALRSDASYYRSYVTSVLPALSISSSDEKIQSCLALPIGALAGTTAEKSQIKCLDETDTPINIQVQDYAYNGDAE